MKWVVFGAVVLAMFSSVPAAHAVAFVRIGITATDTPNVDGTYTWSYDMHLESGSFFRRDTFQLNFLSKDLYKPGSETVTTTTYGGDSSVTWNASESGATINFSASDTNPTDPNAESRLTDVNFQFISSAGPNGSTVAGFGSAGAIDELTQDLLGPATATTPGISDVNPLVVPLNTGAGTYDFTGIRSDVWVDPPTTYGYLYDLTSGGTITEIAGLPSGYSNLTVEDGSGNIIGTITDSGAISPSNPFPINLSEFQILGIAPPVDGTNSNAFPVLLEFSNATGNNLTVTPLDASTPEPTSLLLFGLGMVGLAGSRWRRGRQSQSLLLDE
ncbi:MAG TPA: PEP-CTERM sorting domain-containing protein [Pirellulales bacterium]|nr:PEP-CTERM sorting domain-containing protein [Pirellulales bacterium]